MAGTIRLSRVELAEFLPSQRAVKTFEALADFVSENQDVDLGGSEIEAGTALAGVEALNGQVSEIQGQSLQVMVWLGI